MHLRLPHGLHSQLKQRAAEQGVNANSLAVLLVAGGLRFALDDKEAGRPNARPPATRSRRDLDEQQPTD